jgi:hypothetical protein
MEKKQLAIDLLQKPLDKSQIINHMCLSVCICGSNKKKLNFCNKSNEQARNHQ